MRKVGLPDLGIGHPGGRQRNQLRVVVRTPQHTRPLQLLPATEWWHWMTWLHHQLKHWHWHYHRCHCCYQRYQPAVDCDGCRSIVVAAVVAGSMHGATRQHCHWYRGRTESATVDIATAYVTIVVVVRFNYRLCGFAERCAFSR